MKNGVGVQKRLCSALVVVSLILAIHATEALAEVRYTVTGLGTLPGGSSSFTSSINASGQVAGYSGTIRQGHEHAFLYSNETMTDLSTLGGAFSYASGINNSGQVVGWSYTTDTLGWTLSVANAINDNGQIVGTGNMGGFLLTPIPEPTTLSLLGIGLIALMRRRGHSR